MAKNKAYMTDMEIFVDFAYCRICNKKARSCECDQPNLYGKLTQCEKMMQKARSEDRRQSMDAGLIDIDKLVAHVEELAKVNKIADEIDEHFAKQLSKKVNKAATKKYLGKKK